MSKSGSDRQPEQDPRPRSEAPDHNDKEPVEESRIIIRPDGEVVIENLSALLAEVAEELDPDVELACEVELSPASDDPGDPGPSPQAGD